MDVRRNLTANKITVQLDHFSTFALAGSKIPVTSYSPPSGGGSGGGGGGGGTSGENFSNVELKEKYDLSIFKDIVTSYRFRNESNPVISVNITGNVSAGLITTMVELLRNTSSQLKEPAPGVVYENINIWVGTSGFAGPKNIKEAVISFRVTNAWLSEKNIAAGDIQLLTWDGSKWASLETMEETRDSIFTYYKAKTDRFSHFAITGIKNDVIPAVTPTSSIQANLTSTATARSNPVRGTSGFEIIVAIIAVTVIYVVRKSIVKEK